MIGNKSIIMITHYQRLLDYIQPQFIHVMSNGKIIKTGNYMLAKELEWVRMNPKARQAKSKARLSNYDKLLSEDLKDREDVLEIPIPNGPRLGMNVIDAEKVGKSFGEKLLYDDMLKASKGVNKILDDWELEDIKPRITQGMYNVMASIAYNYGVNNLRMSDFIQYVKRGELEKAKEEIKNISSNLFDEYPGLKKRREEESKMFKLPKEF
jgi:ABC-type multidrug transport system ATPase subunit